MFSLESTRHDNIIEYMTCGSHQAGGVVHTSPLQLHLVTRYYPLGTLGEHLRKNVLSWKQACCVVKSVAGGLKHLHSEYCVNGAGMDIEKYPIAHRWVWPCWGTWYLQGFIYWNLPPQNLDFPPKNIYGLCFFCSFQCNIGCSLCKKPHVLQLVKCSGEIGRVWFIKMGVAGGIFHARPPNKIS